MPVMSSTETIIPPKGSIPLILALIIAGLAGNYFKYPIFLNIDFLFGSIFAMLALQFFGLGRGIATAAIIASYTYVLWNHPYAIIIMTAEVAVVGLLVKRRNMGLVLADTIYWLCIGMPLVYIFYSLFMHAAISSVSMTMTKQAMNGITNALIARLVFTVYALRSRSTQIKYREIIYDLLTLFVLFPSLCLLAISSRFDFNETDSNIRHMIVSDSHRLDHYVDTWVINRKASVMNLADMASSKSPQQMQSHLEQIRKSDANFLRVGLLDRDATITAYSPLIDELGQNNIGKNFADRPFIPELKQTLKPMLSEVVMGKIGTPKPMVTMLAPVIIRGEYGGYISGVLNLEQIKAQFEKSLSENGTLYTLLDKSGAVILTSRTDQKQMQPFVRGEGAFKRLDKNVSQWIPKLPHATPASERWRKSLYVTEAKIGDLAEWTMVLEQPVAPFQKRLYDKYTGKLFLLFLILLGALALAELLSRKIITSLESLRLVTRDIPTKLAAVDDIHWPETSISELKQLIDNFKETTNSLVAQSSEVLRINESLELRIEERTSELQQKMIELKQSEQRLDQMAEHSRTINWEVDAQGLYTFVSHVSEEIIGYSPDDLVGKKYFYNIHPDEGREEFKKAAFEVFDQKGVFQNLANSIMAQNGVVVWVSTNGFPLLDENGDLMGYRGSDTDITERRKEEKILKEQAALLNVTHDSIIVRDMENNITYWNTGATKQYGWDAQEVVGKIRTHDLFHTVFPLPLDQISNMLFQNDFWEGDLTHTRRDGTQIIVASRWVVQRSDDNTPVGIMEINNNITDRKKAEEEKLQLEQQFQQTQKLESLGVLSGGIAHDFNNILAIIKGNCSLAKIDEENAGNYIPEIEKASERAAELCRQMMAYAGKAQLNQTNVNFRSLVVEIADMLQKTIPKNAVIKLDGLADIPSIKGDASQLNQVVMNLIINASEAIGNEQGEIEVLLSEITINEDKPCKDNIGKNIPPGLYVCLEVTDNGCGMDEETKWRIFEPFYTTKFTGRGLGMSAVLGIISSHNGALQLHSQLGHGATFKVYLPVPKKQSTVDEHLKQFVSPVPWRGSGTILLVEDEEQVRVVAKALLENIGFTVMDAANGKEALELYQKNATDISLVMTDMGMPIMDGYELFNELKKLNPELPIIVSSGYGDAEVSSRLSIDDIAGLISKPYGSEQLQEVLRKALDSSP